MNRKDKLLERFSKMPKDFTFDEIEAVFRDKGFSINNKGMTSGSRVEFVNEEKGLTYIMHKPHPSNIVKGYVMKQVLNFFKTNGLI